MLVCINNVSEKEEKNKNQTVKQFYVIVVLYYSTGQNHVTSFEPIRRELGGGIV